MNEALALGKTEYLGNLTNIRFAEGVIISAVTADPSEISNDALHYHENPILSFILEGDSFEQINREINRRSAGDIRFYRAGDLHQVKIQSFPSRNVNFEIEGEFFAQNGFCEEKINAAIQRNPFAKSLFLRMYREFSIGDALTNSSIQILLLNLLTENP